MANASRVSDGLRRLVEQFGVSRAVGYSVLTKGWSTVSGPATALLIAHFLTESAQGYYYTFGSILALQMFVELGLTGVIVQVVAHEWAFLERTEEGGIAGEGRALSRLGSIARIVTAWYAVAAVIVAAGLGVAGYVFFSANSDGTVAWEAPWVALATLTGVCLITTPIIAVLEGCNQISAVYGYRLVNGLLSSGAIIGAVVVGHGLYGPALAALVRAILASGFVVGRYGRFVRQIMLSPVRERVAWHDEIWPFQWRIAVTWLTGYFSFYLFNPIMFHYHGPVVAGRMGMTLAATGALQALAFSWVQTRIPRFGVLIARKEYGALDSLFRRMASMGIGVYVLGGALGMGAIIWLNVADHALATRLLAPLAAGLLIGEGVLRTYLFALGGYLRAHKREPLVWVSAGGSALVAVAVWLLGAAHGPTGAAVGQLGVTVLYSAPLVTWVFVRCRRKWHSEELDSRAEEEAPPERKES